MEKNIVNLIAPPGLEINSGYLKLGDKFVKTIFVFTYPRYLSVGWFSGIINMPELLDISIFIHPVETPLALKNLRKKQQERKARLPGKIRNVAFRTRCSDGSLPSFRLFNRKRLWDV